MALAGLTLSGCRRWPEEKLAPYSTNPRGRMPGVPEQYATAMELGGVAQPLLVTSFDGRPIKIEGNPSHPFSWTVEGQARLGRRVCAGQHPGDVRSAAQPGGRASATESRSQLGTRLPRFRRAKQFGG